MWIICRHFECFHGAYLKGSQYKVRSRVSYVCTIANYLSRYLYYPEGGIQAYEDIMKFECFKNLWRMYSETCVKSPYMGI